MASYLEPHHPSLSFLYLFEPLVCFGGWKFSCFSLFVFWRGEDLEGACEFLELVNTCENFVGACGCLLDPWRDLRLHIWSKLYHGKVGASPLLHYVSFVI